MGSVECNQRRQIDLQNRSVGLVRRIENNVTSWALSEDGAWCAVATASGGIDSRATLALIDTATGREAFALGGFEILGMRWLSSERLMVIRAGRNVPRATVVLVPDGSICDEVVLNGMCNAHKRIDVASGCSADRSVALISDSVWGGARGSLGGRYHQHQPECFAAVVTDQPLQIQTRYSSTKSSGCVQVPGAQFGLVRLDPDGDKIYVSLSGTQGDDFQGWKQSRVFACGIASGENKELASSQFRACDFLVCDKTRAIWSQFETFQARRANRIAWVDLMSSSVLPTVAVDIGQITDVTQMELSPDSQSIMMLLNASSSRAKAKIRVLNLDGAPAYDIYTMPRGIVRVGASWNANGSGIWLAEQSNSSIEIFHLDLGARKVHCCQILASSSEFSAIGISSSCSSSGEVQVVSWECSGGMSTARVNWLRRYSIAIVQSTTYEG